MALYVITDEHLLPDDRLASGIEAAIRGGAGMVQFREKCTPAAERRARALQVLAVCRDRGVPMIVNDDVALARAIGADGVHLGRDDGPVHAARAVLGDRATIGVSCYADLSRAREAERDGADYVAFGSMFPSRLKPEAVRASLDLLAEAAAVLRIPVCAIGGITAETAPLVTRHGATHVAVCHAVFAAPDVAAAARAMVAAMAVSPAAVSGS